MNKIFTSGTMYETWYAELKRDLPSTYQWRYMGKPRLKIRIDHKKTL